MPLLGSSEVTRYRTWLPDYYIYHCILWTKNKRTTSQGGVLSVACYVAPSSLAIIFICVVVPPFKNGANEDLASVVSNYIQHLKNSWPNELFLKIYDFPPNDCHRNPAFVISLLFVLSKKHSFCVIIWHRMTASLATHIL